MPCESVVKTACSIALSLLLGVLPCTDARADRIDFIVNDDGGTAEQTQPRVAPLAGGGCALLWSDSRNGNGDIYLQRLNMSGGLLDANIRVNDDTIAAHQTGPSISVDYSGRFLAVWQDYRTGTYPFDPQVYFQRFDSSASRLNTNTRATSELPDSLKENPDVQLAPWGYGVIVWADYRNRNWDIYGQRISSTGSLIGNNFRVNDDLVGAQQHAPRVAVSPQGWFVVTWYDNRAGTDDIFIQLYDSSAAKVGANIRVNTDGTVTRQAFPDVAADAMGHFTVVWTDWRNGVYPANPDIYARKYDTLLNALYADRKVSSDNSGRPQRDPAIAADRLGNVAIVWADSSSSSWDIIGQMIDASGTVRENNFRANTLGDSAQLQPDVALDGRYRYIVWTDRRMGQHDIYASIATYNTPRLMVSPAALTFTMSPSGALPAAQTVAVNHGGYNPLNFRASSGASWLNVSPAVGLTPNTLVATITDSTLSDGTYVATIRLVDTDNNDSSLAVAVSLNVSSAQPGADSIVIGSAQVLPGASRAIPIDLVLSADIQVVQLPMIWDTTLFRIDSILFDSLLDPSALREWQSDPSGGQALLRCSRAGTFLTAGAHHLADLYLTAGLVPGTGLVDSTTIDTATCHLVRTDGQPVVPTLLPGHITVSDPTPVEDPSEAGLPTGFALHPNYPNPFNASTVIAYDIGARSEVTLEIFNILGQRIARLVDGDRPAGQYSAFWNGVDDADRPAPTGVYFYRLQAGPLCEIRKMVLLK